MFKTENIVGAGDKIILNQVNIGEKLFKAFTSLSIGTDKLIEAFNDVLVDFDEQEYPIPSQFTGEGVVITDLAGKAFKVFEDAGKIVYSSEVTLTKQEILAQGMQIDGLADGLFDRILEDLTIIEENQYGVELFSSFMMGDDVTSALNSLLNESSGNEFVDELGSYITSGDVNGGMNLIIKTISPMEDVQYDSQFKGYLGSTGLIVTGFNLFNLIENIPFSTIIAATAALLKLVSIPVAIIGTVVWKVLKIGYKSATSLFNYVVKDEGLPMLSFPFIQESYDNGSIDNSGGVTRIIGPTYVLHIWTNDGKDHIEGFLRTDVCVPTIDFSRTDDTKYTLSKTARLTYAMDLTGDNKLIEFQLMHNLITAIHDLKLSTADVEILPVTDNIVSHMLAVLRAVHLDLPMNQPDDFFINDQLGEIYKNFSTYTIPATLVGNEKRRTLVEIPFTLGVPSAEYYYYFHDSGLVSQKNNFLRTGKLGDSQFYTKLIYNSGLPNYSDLAQAANNVGLIPYTHDVFQSISERNIYINAGGGFVVGRKAGMMDVGYARSLSFDDQVMMTADQIINTIFSNASQHEDSDYIDQMFGIPYEVQSDISAKPMKYWSMYNGNDSFYVGVELPRDDEPLYLTGKGTVSVGYNIGLDYVPYSTDFETNINRIIRGQVSWVDIEENVYVTQAQFMLTPPKFSKKIILSILFYTLTTSALVIGARRIIKATISSKRNRRIRRLIRKTERRLAIFRRIPTKSNYSKFVSTVSELSRLEFITNAQEKHSATYASQIANYNNILITG